MSATGLRVLLVNCNTPMDNLIPAGVSLLSAVLKSEGCEVCCFDTTFYRPADFVTGDEARAMTLQVKRTNFSELGIHPKPNAAEADFRALVAELQPDLIGFSVIECTHHLALTLARAIADYRPEVPRIWGNVHATFAADRIIGAPEIDMLCVGEGEVAIRALARALAAGRRPSGIPNLWIKNGGVERNALAPLVKLDDLPEQDWEIWERERFFKPMGGRIWVTGTFEMNRGCPYSCMYCVNYPYHGTRLREIAEEKGYIARDAVAGDYRKDTIMRMPHLSPEEIKGLQRTFPLYVKMPKARWPEILRAEAPTPEGDRVYAALAQEYTERHG